MSPISGKADLCLSLVILTVGGVFIFEGSRLPGSQFDALGPGGVPIGIGILICVLGAWIGMAALRGQPVGGGQRMFSGLEEEDTSQNLEWRRLIVVLCISAAYLILLSFQLLSFSPSTIVYMMCLFVYLGDRSWKSLVVSTPLVVGFVIALDQVFRNILHVNLP